jgi:hypothetical protein
MHVQPVQGNKLVPPTRTVHIVDQAKSPRSARLWTNPSATAMHDPVSYPATVVLRGTDSAVQATAYANRSEMNYDALLTANAALCHRRMLMCNE